MITLCIGAPPGAQIGQEDGIQACVIRTGRSVGRTPDCIGGEWGEPEGGVVGAEKVLPIVALLGVGHARLGQLGPHRLEGARLVAELVPGGAKFRLQRFVPDFARPRGQEIAATLFLLQLIKEVAEFLLAQL